MFFLIKGANGITQVSENSQMLSGRRIFIEGEITEQASGSFIKQLIFLASGKDKDSAAAIDIFINSSGGEVRAGLAMYDAMRLISAKIPLRTICIGKAYSMAAILFTAGSRRLMLPHSELMIHEPALLSAQGSCSTYGTLQSETNALGHIREQIVEILTHHTGRSREEIEKAIGYDHFFSAREAIAFGLCDDELDGLEVLS